MSVAQSWQFLSVRRSIGQQPLKQDEDLPTFWGIVRNTRCVMDVTKATDLASRIVMRLLRVVIGRVLDRMIWRKVPMDWIVRLKAVLVDSMISVLVAAALRRIFLDRSLWGRESK